MTDHDLTLTLPDAIFDPIRQIAEATSQSVEQVVIGQLRSVTEGSELSLPPDEEAELAAFRFLSDDVLRMIVREQMPRRDQERMDELMTRNNLGTITPDEYQELSEWVERGQRLMLRKAWAADVLMNRGYSITGDDFTPDA